MSNTLTLAGVQMDLGDSLILPSFQVSDLLSPSTIQSDFSPEFSVPATTRNHALLGQAAVDGNAARVPYRSLANVTLRSEGIEIMPRARMFVKGYEDSQYQLQLFAGNRRFVEALGEKTLRELDFSRFNHPWTLPNIASRCDAAYWDSHGWGYELFDRGKPLNLLKVDPYQLFPTLSANLIWEQIRTDAGFGASPWESPLLDKLLVPATVPAQLSEEFREARRLRVGLGAGHEDDGEPSSGRSDVVRTIPFDDYLRPIGNVPPIVPTTALVYDPLTFSWRADQVVYVKASARTVILIDYSDIRLGRAQGRVELHVNGQRVVEGEDVVATTDQVYSVGVSTEQLLLQPGDRLTAVLVLSGVGNAPVDKWGYRIFRDSVFQVSGQSIPVDKFEVDVLPTLPPGGAIQLADWLPDMKQLDFFKTLVQLGGLNVQCDAYEDYMYLNPSRTILDNVENAHDWTAKRDTPHAPAGAARKVAYRYGSFGQRNWLRYAEDELVTKHYGDGYFLLADDSLPTVYEMLRLPFAATENSKDMPGLLRIQLYKLRENEDPFAPTEYDLVTPKPRLTLVSGRTLAVTLSETRQVNGREVVSSRSVVLPVSHFADTDEEESLDAHTYVLPVSWAGLQAQLTDCRHHTERYRLSPRDLAAFLENTCRPVWDGVLKGYFSVSAISEYSALRPVEVQMLRLHPSFLTAPAPRPDREGLEWAGEEFYTGNGTLGEFY